MNTFQTILVIVPIIFFIIVVGSIGSYFEKSNQIRRLIHKIMLKKILEVETETFIIYISEDEDYCSNFKNKKTKWSNSLCNANSRTKDPLYKELKEWCIINKIITN